MNVSTTAAGLTAEGVAYAPAIADAANRHGLDPQLLAAVAAQETGGPDTNAGRNVIGDGGHGHGLFQIDDRYHAFAGTKAAMDPEANADYAAGMLSGLIKRYGGNVKAALAAYNSGSPNATGTTTQWSGGRVLGYADSVMQHYQRLAGGSMAATSSALEECRAEQPSTSEMVNALAAQAMAMPLTMPSIPTASSSWQQTEGLDATGHPRDQQTSDADIIDNEGDD